MDQNTIRLPDTLLYSKIIIIKYETINSKGIMVVEYNYYMKNIKKFQRKLKDCNIYYMSECVYTPELEKELKL